MGKFRGDPSELCPEKHAPLLSWQREQALHHRRSDAAEASISSADGRSVPVLVQTTLLPSRAPAVHLLSLVDISRQKRTELALSAVARELEVANARLHDLAMRDALTGVQNRRGFEQALAVELCAILVDLDDFKAVNDTFGHAAGDTVLATVARRLADALRPVDQIARIGGDEFVALLPDTNFAQATVVAERLRLAGAQPVPLADGAAYPTLSLAVAAVAHEAASLEAILSATRAALKESKCHGKNRVSLAPSSGSAPRPPAPSVFQLLTRPAALAPVFAPIVELEAGRVVGYEVLVRGPAGPLHMPGDLFRVAAAESELTAVDLQCLRACMAAAAAIPAGLVRHVNLYPTTLVGAAYDRIAELLPESAAAHGLCVELSEQHMVGDPAEVRSRALRLRQRGVRIAIDDVGFGRTCLESLIVLEPELVKIDRAYIAGVSRDHGKARLLRRLVQVAESIRAVTVGEGIESAQDLDVVRDLGVRYGQGYLWGPTGSPARDPGLIERAARFAAEAVESGRRPRSRHRSAQPPMARMERCCAVLSVQPFHASPSGLCFPASWTPAVTPLACPAPAGAAAARPWSVARHGRRVPSLATRSRSQPLQKVSVVPLMKPTRSRGSCRARTYRAGPRSRSAEAGSSSRSAARRRRISATGTTRSWSLAPSPMAITSRNRGVMPRSQAKRTSASSSSSLWPRTTTALSLSSRNGALRAASSPSSTGPRRPPRVMSAKRAASRVSSEKLMRCRPAAARGSARRARRVPLVVRARSSKPRPASARTTSTTRG